MEDALAFLDRVKSTCPERYNEFLDVMKAFKAQQLNTSGVIARVGSMFVGHEALLAGFSIFLPAGHADQLQQSDAPPCCGRAAAEAPSGANTTDDAVVFVTTVKRQCTRETYRSFLAVLHSYAAQAITIEQVCARVGGLFAGREDLLHGFVAYLPDSVRQEAKDELMRTHSLGAGVAALSLEDHSHCSK